MLNELPKDRSSKVHKVENCKCFNKAYDPPKKPGGSKPCPLVLQLCWHLHGNRAMIILQALMS